VAIQRNRSKNPEKLIHRLDAFGSLLESQFTGQPPQPIWEEEPELPASPEEVLDNWLEFRQGPSASDDTILPGPYTENPDPTNPSLDLLDSFLSGGK